MVRVELSPRSAHEDGHLFCLQFADARIKTRGPALGLRVPQEIGAALTYADGTVTATTVSLGPKDSFDSEAVRRAGAAVAGWMRRQSIEQAAVDLATIGVRRGRELCEGLVLGDFSFDHHKSADGRKPRSELVIRLLAGKPSAALRRTLEQTKTVCDATNWARELGHEPPNVINPVTLAERARTMARKCGLQCRILDEKRLASLKMGGLLAVGTGSVTPPRLIVLEHRGRRRGKPVVLVGKAITFDTGGYSLKLRDGMVGMKYDKCGAMAVLAAMQALAALKVKQPVVAVIAAAENMISGKAYRPDDIITMMNGKTVEIVSADAEGRMVLADALTYAQKNYTPRVVIDLATLTGGVVVALGTQVAGVLSNNEALQRQLVAAGKRTHERLWPLPVWDEFLDLINSDDADFKNSGSREGHCIIGGVFLKQFVDAQVPWAHLDIAGVATTDKARPYCPKGATGFGVRLLVDYLGRLGSR